MSSKMSCGRARVGGKKAERVSSYWVRAGRERSARVWVSCTGIASEVCKSEIWKG